MPMGTLHIGLTGGIGSGKSTVASLLQRKGAALIDVDAISRSLTATGGAGIAPIRLAFGNAFISPDGSLNRVAMRSHVFQHPQAKAQLEALLHPMIAQLTHVQARQSSNPLVVFDVPLLVESAHWRARVDTVWVVDCERETQVRRVLARSGTTGGWTRDTAEKVIAAQANPEQRARAADAVIYNEGLSLPDLELQLDALLAQWRARFGL